MSDSRIGQSLSLFIVIVVLILALTAFVSLFAGGGGAPDGQQIEGQSPSQFQPENVQSDFDPDSGTLSVNETGDTGRILVDTSHRNAVTESQLEPLIEAAYEAGHRVDYGVGPTQDFTDALSEYDGVLIVQPADSFTDDQRAALREYTEGGGHVVILAEPTQLRGGFGLFSSPTQVSFGPTNLTSQYGIRIGAQRLYNMRDDRNDNNFKSIYATPAANDPLTSDVDTISFDTSGYVALGPDSDAEVLYTAAEGTRTLETRKTGTYPTVVRSGNLVFVADASFIKQSEIYDVDNEAFIGNLLTYLAGGDPVDINNTDGSGDTGQSPTETPTGTPGETPTRTPTPTPSFSGSADS